MFSRARWRLTIWFAAAFIIILGLIGFAVFYSARTALFDQVNGDLKGRAGPLLQGLVARAHRGGPGAGLDIPRAFTAGGYQYVVVDPNGNIVEESPNLDHDAIAPLGDAQGAIVNGARFVDTRSSEGDDLRMYLLPVVFNDGSHYVMEVGRSTEPEREALKRLLLILAAGGFGGLVLAVAGGYFLAGRTLKPIQTAMGRQKAFVADASHELRTPLALIRANAEILKRGRDSPVTANEASVDDIIAETDRLSYLVGQMLSLARADSGEAKWELASVDLGDLVDNTAREMRLLAAPKDIRIDVQRNGPASVVGDRTRLAELVTILLDNSIKYSGAGARVGVDVAPAGESVRLQVSDSGPGIPPEALPSVFERFYRADKGRSREMGGTGLGLAIAKWIAESHHGTIGIDSAPGKGTTVTVTLPAAAATA